MILFVWVLILGEIDMMRIFQQQILMIGGTIPFSKGLST